MQSITYTNNDKDNKFNNNGINQNMFFTNNDKYEEFDKYLNNNKIERNNDNINK